MIKRDTILSCSSIVKKFGAEIKDDYCGVSTDTRTIKAGELFIALDGAKFKGIEFLTDAILKGASAVVFKSSHLDEEKLKHLSEKNRAVCFIQTTDSLTFLQELSSLHLSKWRQKKDSIVIGITGSNGKTTTKEMIYHLLDGIYPGKVKATIGNLNNHIGVPLTILRADDATKVMIIEMGTNHPGEIEKLCEIAPPDYGILTSIGASHLEFFKTEENVFKEKIALYEAVKVRKHHNGVVVIPVHDQHLRNLKGAPKVLALGDGGDIWAQVSHEGVQIKMNGELVDLKNKNINGAHNFSNLMLSFVLTEKITRAPSTVLTQIAETFIPKKNRSSWIKGQDKEIFLDAYNANPSSMRCALDSFCEYVTTRGGTLSESLFVLGDMNELGELSGQLHEEIGAYLNTLGGENVIFVGRYRHEYRKGFRKSGDDFEKSEFLTQCWQAKQKKFKYIFIKASRSLQLETVLGIT